MGSEMCIRDRRNGLARNASPESTRLPRPFCFRCACNNKGIDGSMNVSETKSDGLLREYKIVITADEIEAEVTKKLEEIAATVKMPGFRPGKVPLSVVKTRFGDQARGEAIKTALDEGARQAIEGNDLKLASQPKVDIQSYEDNKDLEASLACEVMPAITVPDLAKLSIEKPRMESDFKEIEEALSRIADENRSTVALAKPRAAKLGDVVTINFIGRIDGCLLYTSPSPRDGLLSRMPSSA